MNAKVDSHIGNKSNPHGVTRDQLGPPRAEEPLNPGDTKMLDEFLGSFAIKETLQHA